VFFYVADRRIDKSQPLTVHDHEYSTHRPQPVEGSRVFMDNWLARGN
jgi:hypothetical protein